MATYWYIPDEPCGICGHTGNGWYCTFDHEYQSYPVLEGLS